MIDDRLDETPTDRQERSGFKRFHNSILFPLALANYFSDETALKTNRKRCLCFTCYDFITMSSINSPVVFGISERAFNALFSQASHERVRHSLHRRSGVVNPISKQTLEWQSGGTGFRRALVAKVCLANIEKPAQGRAGEFLHVQGVSYRPPGTEATLLDNVNLSLPEKSLGLLYGPSGSGKTTLLHVLGGLTTPTEGSIFLGNDDTNFTKKSAGPGSLSARVGIVFQFPERYFLTDTIVEELLFGYPRHTPDMKLRQMLTLRLQSAVFAVGLSGFPLDMNPRALSDGYKRRLALAVQLVRMPDVMLLDEPLAGLDWRARADVVKLLSALKKEKTVIVVSHDLRELAGLVDKSWRMEMGGKLTEQPSPRP